MTFRSSVTGYVCAPAPSKPYHICIIIYRATFHLPIRIRRWGGGGWSRKLVSYLRRWLSVGPTWCEVGPESRQRLWLRQKCQDRTWATCEFGLLHIRILLSRRPVPANTRRWINVGLTLAQWTNVKPTLIQRLEQQWANVKPTLIQRLVPSGMSLTKFVNDLDLLSCEAERAYLLLIIYRLHHLKCRMWHSNEGHIQSFGC